MKTTQAVAPQRQCETVAVLKNRVASQIFSISRPAPTRTLKDRQERSCGSRRLASVQRAALSRALQLVRLGRHSLVVTSEIVEPFPECFVLHAIGNVTALLRTLLKQRLRWIPVAHVPLPRPSSRLMESSSGDNALRASAEAFYADTDHRLDLYRRHCRIPRMYRAWGATEPRRSVTLPAQELGPAKTNASTAEPNASPASAESAAGGLFG
jgi:hypothetical protein